jgi:putative ABC transport system ATP-binding protein
MSEAPLLEARNLCRSFRTGKSEVRAIRDVSLIIQEGSLTLLTGPSGSGKTTLLSLLGALDRPNSGQILFRGSVLSGFSDIALARLRRRMGFVFQNFSLIAGLPIWENITYPLVPRGMHRHQRWTLAQQLLARMGMEDKLNRLPEELSGGEKQRVAVARALAGQPEIILADEPISNLDQVNGRAVLAMLEAFHKEGKTVILSVHDPAMVSLPACIHELENGQVRRTASQAHGLVNDS